MTLALAFIALYVAHVVADHWAQTGHQAINKGLPGAVGRRACAAHVATHTVISLAAIMTTAAVAEATFGLWQTAAGLALNAGSHYVADRRAPLIRIARLLGSGGYIDTIKVVREPGTAPDTTGPGTGLFHLDQSWHLFFIFVSALIIGA